MLRTHIWQQSFEKRFAPLLLSLVEFLPLCVSSIRLLQYETQRDIGLPMLEFVPSVDVHVACGK